MTMGREDAYAAVDALAEWSEWQPFAVAAPRAPLVPGAYQMRLREGTIVYIDMAGERRGQGIRGRLSMYRRGKGAVSGFGEAALDRALANASFIEDDLDSVCAGTPARASVRAQDAIRWLDVEIRWAECDTREAALTLETAALDLLMTHVIWNRVASRGADGSRLRESPADSVPVSAVDGVMTVALLTAELGRVDGGKAVRRALLEGLPEHDRGSSWDPLTAVQVAYVRSRLAR
ncbi:hypothetical protein CSX12_11025 [Microbacterium sp. Y-01]|uniref:hypothetical protein n=1 Tax=Microbacterium sp. Y-01 TaxID=2048898 RepID=UPI000F6004A6|nr:hypothetical protein [Microbacterium sp. Y-01]AZH78959.1 hypothetical protein CSX12_11025 [Microbacterium sp. Y-01]